jgi:hypothetical protein
MAFSPTDRNKLIAGLILTGVAVLMVYNAFPGGRGVPPAGAPRPSAPAASAQKRGGKTGLPPPEALEPKLRLDLLAKSLGVTYEPTGGRNVFAYFVPPPPPLPQPVVNPVRPGGSTPGSVGAMTPGMAQVQPIPLTYYGYVYEPTGTSKKVLLRMGEEIFIAQEGSVVAKRYRIVKIGVNTVEVEDLVTKGRQTLVLQDNP